MDSLEKAARALLDAEFSSDPEVWGEALEALRAALEAERWVPCSERMPPLQETVLVAIGGKLWMSYLTSHRFLLARKEKWSGAISDRSITHWRPLPKGPEEEG